jgi:hypothetical protein
MTDMRGPSVSPNTPSGPLPPRLDARSPRKSPETPRPEQIPAQEGQFDTRVLLAQISSRALAIQRSASAARKAMETLGQIEDAFVFALDAAREAQTARSLPEEALSALQSQVDLAVSSVDCVASWTAYGDRAIFGGDFALEVDSEKFGMPRLSSRDLGGNASAGGAWASYGVGLPYSQSVASTMSGGPNSLLVWAGGASDVLAAGLAKVREVRRDLEAFYENAIVPKVAALAVALANGVASATNAGNLSEATSILGEVRRELQKTPYGAGGIKRADGVLRLLE